jgi:XTP/dITP diphosphohydrolase
LADRRLVIATGNAGKLGEYQDLLASIGVQLVPFDSGIEEVGKTYRDNARLKAEAARDSTGLPSLGDDAGVEVDVLGGFPGVVSARIGPTQKERTQALLDRLKGHPQPWFARFVCTIALTGPGHETELFEGSCSGEIVPEWRGNAGFGYDPIFLVPEVGRTFGEMTPEEKHRYSHRAAAVREMLTAGALDRLRS